LKLNIINKETKNKMANYIITGGSSYLGREFINLLSANKNDKLIITSRKKIDFGNIIHNQNIKYFPGIDLLNEVDINTIVNASREFFTEQFVVVHCTGYYAGQEPLETTEIEESNRIFESNFLTVYNLSTLLLPVMREKGGGHFIGFSCNSVKYHYPQMAPFTAAKSALESYFKSLANEYYEIGIYANCFQLATLFTEHEVTLKPYGDHKKWLQLSEVANYVEQFVTQPLQLHNGNSIQLYHYSDTFFHKSYFDRIKKSND